MARDQMVGSMFVTPKDQNSQKKMYNYLMHGSKAMIKNVCQTFYENPDYLSSLLSVGK